MSFIFIILSKMSRPNLTVRVRAPQFAFPDLEQGNLDPPTPPHVTAEPAPSTPTHPLQSIRIVTPNAPCKTRFRELAEAPESPTIVGERLVF